MTNVKQVYNERQKIWKTNRGDKKPLQYLISKLEEHNYTYYSRTQSESTTIEDIFWAHPTSVKLLTIFQRFWLWTPPTKPTCIRCQCLR